MQKILAKQKIFILCKQTMVLTVNRKTVAVGTILPMLQEKEIMEVNQNLFKKMMKSILILLQPQQCRS
eukprot:2400025-Prorocentrum_lima.AAC.1